MDTTKRRWRLATVAVAAVAVVAGAPRASGYEVPAVTYTIGEDVRILVDEVLTPTPDAGYADGVRLFHEPGTCAESPSCAEIPIRFVDGAGGSPDQDYLIRLTVEWDSAKVVVPEPAASQAGEDELAASDLDLFLFRAVAGEEGFEEVNRAHVIGPTETMPLFSPRGDYILTVSNHLAPTAGFSLRIHDFRSVDGFDWTPVAVAPGGAPPAPPGVTFEAGRGVVSAPSVRPISPVAAVAPPAAPGVAIAVTDDDFGVTGGRLDDLLAGDTRGSLYAPEEPRTPSPVSPAVAALWLGAVPLLLLTTAVVLLQRVAHVRLLPRRRPAGLDRAPPAG